MPIFLIVQQVQQARKSVTIISGTSRRKSRQRFPAEFSVVKTENNFACALIIAFCEYQSLAHENL
jgi:hypothetical protein